MSELDRVSKVDNNFVWDLVEKTKLPFSAVRALLIRGWVYTESVDAPSRWVSPLGRIDA